MPEAYVDPAQTLVVERRAHSRRGTRGVRPHPMRLPAVLKEAMDREVLDRLSYRERAELATRINSEFERAESRREQRSREFDHALLHETRRFDEGLRGQRDNRRRGGITAEERRNAMHLLFPRDRRFAPVE